MTTNIKKGYKNIRTAGAILQPSPIGIIIYIAIFVALVLINQYSQYIHNALNISQSDFQGTFMYGTVHAFVAFIDNKQVNSVIYFGFWLAIGLVVYLLASTITHFEVEFAHDIIARRYIHPSGTDPNASVKEFALVFVVRLIALIVLIAFIVKALPSLDSWWKQHQDNHNALTYVELFIYLLLIMHILVILLRVFFLRIRLFRGELSDEG